MPNGGESQVLANEIERVMPKVPTLFDRDDTWYSTIEKRNVEVVSARDMRVPLELRPGGFFGHFNPDGGDLGRGNAPIFDKALVPAVYLKFGVEWTKKAEWATDESRKAVVNTFRHIMATSMAEFRRGVDSLCMTDGTGVLATVSNVSTAGGVDTVTLSSDGFRARLLRYGQPINVYNSALTVNRTASGEVIITYHDLAGQQIKFPSVTGLTIGDKIVISGVSATPPVSLLGVPYHQNSASSGFWLGMDRNTTPEIRGNSVAAGGSLAYPFARLALNKIGDRVGQDEIPKVQAWMHPCQKQAYEELGQFMSVINRNQSGGGSFDAYFGDQMSIAGAPVRTSYSWDRTRIDFIVPSAWGRAEIKPAGFYEVDGRKVFELRGASGGVATSQIFYICIGMNIFMNNPVMGSYISGLTIPSGY